MRAIHYIVVHCSATPQGHTLTPQDLEAEHRRRGFCTTGYHFYIRRNGEVIPTRPLQQPGAHVKGYNAHSIGICYEGGLDVYGHPCDTRTVQQRTAIRQLVSNLLRQFRQARVCGHRDLSPDRNGNGRIEPNEWLKQCPCFDVAKDL